MICVQHLFLVCLLFVEMKTSLILDLSSLSFIFISPFYTKGLEKIIMISIHEESNGSKCRIERSPATGTVSCHGIYYVNYNGTKERDTWVLLGRPFNLYVQNLIVV